MKEANLTKCRHIIDELNARRRQLEYCLDEESMLEVAIYKTGKGSVAVGKLSDHTVLAIKAMTSSELKKRIEALEKELETL